MHWLEIQDWLYAWWTQATAQKGWLVVFGLLAQTMFMARFAVQWIASERAKRSVVPEAFWYFSLCGGLLIFTYGILDRDLVVMAGQLPAILIYLRNLSLIWAEKRRTAAPPTSSTPTANTPTSSSPAASAPAAAPPVAAE